MYTEYSRTDSTAVDFAFKHMAPLRLRVWGADPHRWKVDFGVGRRNRLVTGGKSEYRSRTDPDFPPATSLFRHTAPKSTFLLRGSARESGSVNAPFVHIISVHLAAWLTIKFHIVPRIRSLIQLPTLRSNSCTVFRLRCFRNKIPHKRHLHELIETFDIIVRVRILSNLCLTTIQESYLASLKAVILCLN